MSQQDSSRQTQWQETALSVSAVGAFLTVLAILALYAAQVWAERSRPIEIVPLASEREMRVSVQGAVTRPGVYTVKPGDRVEDAIRLAGGFLGDADGAGLNLAAKLVDEQEIIVPRPGEVPRATPTAPATPTPLVRRTAGRLSLNTATSAELEALPGIAELTARRIIESRERVGPFQRIEELRERGIMNEQNFARVRDFVTAP